MCRRLCLLLLPLVLAACAGTAPAPPAAPTVVLVVRHAEKAAGGQDPALTPAGQARAEALAALAAHAGVQAILTTPFRRNRETAQPLAGRLGVPLTVFPEAADAAQHPRLIAERIRAQHAGQTVLVVGHSNTVPGIVEALSGQAVPALADADYDRLYVVVLVPGAAPRLVQARFGAGS